MQTSPGTTSWFAPTTLPCLMRVSIRVLEYIEPDCRTTQAFWWHYTLFSWEITSTSVVSVPMTCKTELGLRTFKKMQKDLSSQYVSHVLHQSTKHVTFLRFIGLWLYCILSIVDHEDIVLQWQALDSCGLWLVKSVYCMRFYNRAAHFVKLDFPLASLAISKLSRLCVMSKAQLEALKSVLGGNCELSRYGHGEKRTHWIRGLF